MAGMSCTPPLDHLPPTRLTLEALAERAAAKGIWLAYWAPFRPGSDHVIGLTPHGTIGRLGRAEIRCMAPTLPECLALAAEALEAYEPGDLDP
jgi:hypothetical protein